MKRAVLAVLCIALLFATGVQPLAAQATRARLIVTVVDPSGGVVPDASVTVVALDQGAAATVIPAVKSTAQGIATVEGTPLRRHRGLLEV